MPGDLKDQEQSCPYYYDSKYEPGTNPFEPGSGNVRKYLQGIALEKNIVISPEKMDDLVRHLEGKGFMHRNPGDETFRNEVYKYLDKVKKARRVARKWLT